MLNNIFKNEIKNIEIPIEKVPVLIQVNQQEESTKV
jgi:hypothetical protein